MIIAQNLFGNLSIKSQSKIYFTGGSQKKIYDFPLTLSGFAKNTESCLTFIELPEIFDNQDIISSTEHVKNRCFDRIVVHIDAR